MSKLKILLSFFLGLFALGSVSACSLLTGGQVFVYGEAKIESIEIQILESFPVQIHVVARGFTPDGCTNLDKVSQKREENFFEVKITTRRPKEAACTLVIQEFEKIIPLDVLNLSAGIYTVSVNGVRDSFELQIDNSIP